MHTLHFMPLYKLYLLIYHKTVVFNCVLYATCNNSATIIGLVLWCLTQLLTIFSYIVVSCIVVSRTPRHERDLP